MLWRSMWLVLVHQERAVLLVSAVIAGCVLAAQKSLLLLWPAKADKGAAIYFLKFAGLSEFRPMYSCAPSMQSSFLLGLWWGWPLVSHLPAWPNLSLVGNLLLRVKVSGKNLGRAQKLLLLHAAIWDQAHNCWEHHGKYHCHWVIINSIVWTEFSTFQLAIVKKWNC